jgi:hypothetical protein
MATTRMAGPDRLNKPVSSANAKKALARIEAECRALLGRGPSESLWGNADHERAMTEEATMALEEFLAEAKKLWNLP